MKRSAEPTVVIALMLLAIIVGFQYINTRSMPAPKKLTAVVTVEVESTKALNLLEMAFNQPLHDGDFQVMSTVVTVSAYTASVDECDGTPWVTANGTPSRIGLIAVSRDILSEIGIKMGQTIVLGQYGVFRVEDVMHKRWKRRVDILHASKKAAKLFGVKKNIKLIWIDWDGRSLVYSYNRTLNTGD